jgi:acyl carrier protein
MALPLYRELFQKLQITGLPKSTEDILVENEKKLREYILDNFLFTDDQSMLKNDDSFLEKGIIDSTGIMELIFFMEEELGVKVEDEEMIPENLDSINSIMSFINKKKS